jgi:hypothetical protein
LIRYQIHLCHLFRPDPDPGLFRDLDHLGIRDLALAKD